MILEKTWAEQDFQKREEQAEKWLRSRPECVCCCEPIQEDVYFEPEPGEILCQECFEQYVRDNFLHEIE